MDEQSAKYIRAKSVRARYGGISNATLYNWIQKGVIPAPMKFEGSNVAMWSVEELDKVDGARLVRGCGKA